MKYLIEYKEPLKGFLHCSLEVFSEGDLHLRLAAWRPGRYERQNFAAFIYRFKAIDLTTNEVLPYEKISRNEWKIKSGHGRNILVTWEYYARQMDAGGSWVDDELFYVNPVNCLLYQVGKEHQYWELELKIPEDFQIASGLTFFKQKASGQGFFELADSPVLASRYLAATSFSSGESLHVIHAHGIEDIPHHVVRDFKKFTDVQIKIMGDFPEQEYHYLLILLPRPHYHGVEHRNSTVIVLGPANEVFGEKLYPELLGISSHELFHAWNILKIRPAEMLPYRYGEENYYTTGFVTEGFTTYYGDLFLVRGDVFSEEDYLGELQLQLKRHFENYGHQNLSLSESSFDLWIDGYSNPSPHRKVSIYVKGCLVAFCLDIKIRKCSNNKKSLDNVMKKLWTDFGKMQKGYTYNDIVWLCSEAAGENLSMFLNTLVHERSDLKKELDEAFGYLGFVLKQDERQPTLEKNFGIRFRYYQDRRFVDNIAPDANAAALLMKDDEVLSLTEAPELLTLRVVRNQKELEISIEKNAEHFPLYYIAKMDVQNDQMMENRSKWLRVM